MTQAQTPIPFQVMAEALERYGAFNEKEPSKYIAFMASTKWTPAFTPYRCTNIEFYEDYGTLRCRGEVVLSERRFGSFLGDFGAFQAKSLPEVVRFEVDHSQLIEFIIHYQPAITPGTLVVPRARIGMNLDYEVPSFVVSSGVWVRAINMGMLSRPNLAVECGREFKLLRDERISTLKSCHLNFVEPYNG